MSGPSGIDETHSLVHGHRPTMEVGHVDINTAEELAGDIAALLWQTIERQPARIDLWLMLFDVCRVQGNRELFRRAVKDARNHTAVNEAMDWGAVGSLWSVFNENESMDAVERAPQPEVAVQEAPLPRQRRLGDMALGVGNLPLERLGERYQEMRREPRFHDRLLTAIAPVLKRPSPLFRLPLSTTGDQARVFLKREDTRHTTPEFENAVMQAYIARQLQKSELLCSNEFRQHSMAVAQVAAAQQMPCTIFVTRQDLKNDLALMADLTDRGARIEITEEDDCRRAALLHWAKVEETAHFIHSLGAGPHPYALLVNDFQSLLGRETLMQYRQQPGARQAIPALVAATQSRADSIGFMLPFLRQTAVSLALVEPVYVSSKKAEHEIWGGAYRERRREQAWIKGSGRVSYPDVSAAEGAKAQQLLREVLPLELTADDARAVAHAMRIAPELTGQDIIVLVG